MSGKELKTLRLEARKRVSEAEASTKKVTFLYCAILFGADLFLSFLSYLVGQKGSGGISATMRLQSIGSVLTGATVLLSFFSIIWQNCYCGYARELVRGKEAGFRTLTGYLNRFGCFFGVRFLTVLYVTLWTLLFMIPGYMLMVQTMSNLQLTEEMMLDYDLAYAVVEEHLLQSPLLPAIIILLALAVIAATFVGLRYRLGQYFALENGFRAKASLRVSKAVMKGHVWESFRLDLSLLWYFIPLAVLSSALSLIPAYVTLSEGAMLLVIAGYYAILLVIQIFALPYVQCCYALYADRLMFPPQDTNGQSLIENQ